MSDNVAELGRKPKVEGLPDEDVLELVFKHPIQIGSATYEKIVLREPTAGEVRKSQGVANGVGSTLSLAQQVAGVPMGVLEKVVISDFMKIDRFFSKFYRDSPEIGPSLLES